MFKRKFFNQCMR